MTIQKRLENLMRKKIYYFYIYKKNFSFDLRQISLIIANFEMLVKEMLVKIHKQAMIFYMIMQKMLEILIQKKIDIIIYTKKTFLLAYDRFLIINKLMPIIADHSRTSN